MSWIGASLQTDAVHPARVVDHRFAHCRKDKKIVVVIKLGLRVRLSMNLSGGLVVRDLRSQPGDISNKPINHKANRPYSRRCCHRSDIDVVEAITAAISTVHATQYYHTLPKLNLKQVKHHIYDAESYNYI